MPLRISGTACSLSWARDFSDRSSKGRESRNFLCLSLPFSDFLCAGGCHLLRSFRDHWQSGRGAGADRPLPRARCFRSSTARAGGVSEKKGGVLAVDSRVQKKRAALRSEDREERHSLSAAGAPLPPASAPASAAGCLCCWPPLMVVSAAGLRCCICCCIRCFLPPVSCGAKKHTALSTAHRTAHSTAAPHCPLAARFRDDPYYCSSDSRHAPPHLHFTCSLSPCRPQAFHRWYFENLKSMAGKVWSGTPIRDISCCFHPLNDVPCLRPGPREGHLDHGIANRQTRRSDRRNRRLYAPPHTRTHTRTHAHTHTHTQLAVGETVILLHAPLPLVGVSIWMERGCQ